MREILFRGKRIDNGEWVYGDFSRYPGEKSIIMVDLLEEEDYWVSSETVGQYTGLTDKNGVKIFEGDAVSYLNSIESGNGFVIFDTCAFLFSWIDIDETDSLLMYFQCSEEMEVIGNIHDNPELMEDNTNDH